VSYLVEGPLPVPPPLPLPVEVRLFESRPPPPTLLDRAAAVAGYLLPPVPTNAATLRLPFSFSFFGMRQRNSSVENRDVTSSVAEPSGGVDQSEPADGGGHRGGLGVGRGMGTTTATTTSGGGDMTAVSDGRSFLFR
jgi:hypothetical protein